MNRSEFQQLAKDRSQDAKALIAARRWSAAYYLAGYAVECGLKSCIIHHLMTSEEFPPKKFSEQCWTHNLSQLMVLAGLEPDFLSAQQADPQLLSNWQDVNAWNESSRYTRSTKTEAVRLYNAVTDKKHGVLTWLMTRW